MGTADVDRCIQYIEGIIVVDEIIRLMRMPGRRLIHRGSGNKWPETKVSFCFGIIIMHCIWSGLQIISDVDCS